MSCCGEPCAGGGVGFRERIAAGYAAILELLGIAVVAEKETEDAFNEPVMRPPEDVHSSAFVASLCRTWNVMPELITPLCGTAPTLCTCECHILITSTDYSSY